MEPIISIRNVSMRFNLAKEKHESLKEYFIALTHGGVRFDEFLGQEVGRFAIWRGVIVRRCGCRWCGLT